MGDWDNSAWKVLDPMTVYRRVGSLRTSNTYIGSMTLLPNIFQEVKLKKGDIVTGLHGGDFVIPKGKSVAFQVYAYLSEKHPFEKSYGGRMPFKQRWPLDKLEQLPEVPNVNAPYDSKEFDAVPKGAKPVGRSGDYVLPADAKLESEEHMAADFLNDFNRIANGRELPTLGEAKAFHHGTVRSWKRGNVMKGGTTWSRLAREKVAPMASKVPEVSQSTLGGNSYVGGDAPVSEMLAQIASRLSEGEIDFKAVAQKMLDATLASDKPENKTQDMLHYRAYLRAIVAGQTAKDLLSKYDGAKKAREDLIDVGGGGPMPKY